MSRPKRSRSRKAGGGRASGTGDPSDTLLRPIRKHFGFLEREHGFSPPKVSGTFPSFNVELRKGGLNVSFASEYFEPPIVFVTRAEPYGSLTLLEAIPLLQPDYLTARPSAVGSGLTEPEIEAWVEYYARFVARHADALVVRPDDLFVRVGALRATAG